MPGNFFKPTFLEKITFNVDAETRPTYMGKQGKSQQNLPSRSFDNKKK